MCACMQCEAAALEGPEEMCFLRVAIDGVDAMADTPVCDAVSSARMQPSFIYIFHCL